MKGSCWILIIPRCIIKYDSCSPKSNSFPYEIEAGDDLHSPPQIFTLLTSHWSCLVVIRQHHPQHWQEQLQSVSAAAPPPPAPCVCAPLTWLMFPPALTSQNSPSRDQLGEQRRRHRTDVAKLTLDLYKTNPSDFIGCLNVKATLYGAYSVSYDLRCYAAKNMLKWVKMIKSMKPDVIYMLLCGTIT